MPRPLHPVKIALKGMGLNDFVAMQEGYVAAEGLVIGRSKATTQSRAARQTGLLRFARNDEWRCWSLPTPLPVSSRALSRLP